MRFSKVKAPKPKKRLLVFFVAAILAISVVVIVGLIIQIGSNLTNDSQDENNIDTNVITYSTEAPEETPPEDDEDWKGSESDPKWIRIPVLGVSGLIEKVGVDQNRQIAVPSNVHMAGWFVDSVKPGQKGLSIIDGHRDGSSVGGIFRELGKLKPSDEFEIEFGDGNAKRFRVMAVNVLSVQDALSPLFSQNPKVSSQLNLITCGGAYNQEARAYEQRILVTSQLIE